MAARERDLQPLIEKCDVALDLDDEQARRMQACLESAWSRGTHNGHEQVRIWAEREGRGGKPKIDTAPVEAEFQEFMERSADSLNLTLLETVIAWQFLTDAWVAGVYSVQEQLFTYLGIHQADIGKEVEGWLEERGKGDNGQGAGDEVRDEGDEGAGAR